MSSGLASEAVFPTTTVGRVAEVQLGKMLQPKPDSPGDLEVHYLRAGSLEGLTGDEALRKMWASTDERASYSVRSGDLIVAEGGDVGRSEFVPEVPADTIIQNSLHRVRPRSGDVRFLKYALDAIYSSGWLDVICNKATFGHLTREKLSSLSIPWPSVEQQRATADYLDAETARIDALIEKKRRLIELLDERRAGRIEHAIRSLVAESGDGPLKYLVREVTVGIVVTPAAWYSETGVPAIRGQNVKPGRIVLDDLVYLTEEGHALHKKSQLRLGDVVVVRTGQAGAAAVVSERVAGANCIDLIVVRPGSAIDASFLEYVLNSDWTQKHVEEHSVGSIQSHFNVSAMKEVPVPLAPVHRQQEVVEELGKLTDRIDKTVARLNHQIELLTEHRRALITAAVTGEVEVAGVQPYSKDYRL